MYPLLACRKPAMSLDIGMALAPLVAQLGEVLPNTPRSIALRASSVRLSSVPYSQNGDLLAPHVDGESNTHVADPQSIFSGAPFEHLHVAVSVFRKALERRVHLRAGTRL